MIRRVASDAFSGAGSLVRSHLPGVMQAIQGGAALNHILDSEVRGTPQATRETFPLLQLGVLRLGLS
jgi:hypothetical protein